MKDSVRSYLDGLHVKVRRNIPSFAEACIEELADATPFRILTWTRTFVAFDNENNFKIYDGTEFLEYLSIRNLEDGFLPITREQYDHLYAAEFPMSESRTMRRSIEEALQDKVLETLIPDENLRRRILQEKEKGVEKIFQERGIPLVWIAKKNNNIPFYMTAMLVGAKEQYLAVGGNRFVRLHYHDEEKYYFHRTKEES